jgi:hypothetical protein
VILKTTSFFKKDKKNNTKVTYKITQIVTITFSSSTHYSVWRDKWILQHYYSGNIFITSPKLLGLEQVGCDSCKGMNMRLGWNQNETRRVTSLNYWVYVCM